MKHQSAFVRTHFATFAFASFFSLGAILAMSSIANANTGTNPVGQTAVLNSSYNNNTYEGYVNYGTATVTGGSFDSNGHDGFDNYGDSGTATVTGGSFESNGLNGFVNYGQEPTTISNGNFSGNGSAGVENYGAGTVTISGGTFYSNGVGVLCENPFSYVTISGGIFTNNGVNLEVQEGNVSITGGDFEGVNPNYSGYDISNGGDLDIYGTGFSGTGVPISGQGDLQDQYGTFTWDLSDGASETLSYFNDGTIDLIQGAPAAAPEASSLAVFAGLVLGFAALIVLSARKRALVALVD
jgi:hypothetical protein